MTALQQAIDEIVGKLAAQQFAQAEALSAGLLQQSPDNPEVLHIAGVVEHRLGRTEAAVDKILAAIKKDEKSAKFHLSLAGILQETGDLKRAENILQRALVWHPKLSELQRRFADVRLARGYANDAIAAYKRLVTAESTVAENHLALARAFRKTGRFAEAVGGYLQAYKIAPQDVATLIELGDLYSSIDKLDDAIKCYVQALRIAPQAPGLFNKVGLLYMSIYAHDEAVSIFREGIRFNPKDIACHVNLGVALFSLGKNAEAARSLQFAANVDATKPHALNALAILAQTEGQTDVALRYYDQVLALDPSFDAARYNRALMNLRLGRLTEGFAEYEWRWKGSTSRLQTKVRPFQQPLWTGEDLKNKRLLVWGEQGIGDEIRTAGLIPDLIERKVQVVLECEHRLVPLFQRSFENVEVVPRKNPPAAAATHAKTSRQIPADSLAGILRPTLSAFPHRPAYLKVDADKIASFKAELATPPGYRRVGISWVSKNAQFGFGKSSALEFWEPILKIQKCQFIDLQYGDTSAERHDVQRKLGISITHVPHLDLKDDIDGLAALVSSCDLVITISNTTAHLAGALGVPTWVMLPGGYFQTWYWFADRLDSPWYPSVKLYRQQELSEWTKLIRNVASDLAS